MGPNGCTGCSFGNTQQKRSSTSGTKRRWYSYSTPSNSAQPRSTAEDLWRSQYSSAFRAQLSPLSTNGNSNSLSSDYVGKNSDPVTNIVQPSSSQYVFRTSAYSGQSSSLNSAASFSHPAHPYLTRSSSPTNSYNGQTPSNMEIDTVYLIGGYFSPQQSNRVEKNLNAYESSNSVISDQLNQNPKSYEEKSKF